MKLSLNAECAEYPSAVAYRFSMRYRSHGGDGGKPGLQLWPGGRNIPGQCPNVKEGVWVTCNLDITLSESDAGASLSCLNVGMATDPSIGIDYDDVKVVATYVLEDSG